MELLEYQYPILIHRYGLNPDSGGAGRYRGGCGTVWEVEPLEHTMTVIAFGEGRQIPTMGAAGAQDSLVERKLGRLEIDLPDGNKDVYVQNTLTEIQPGQRARNYNPGGGGYGNPFERPAAEVALDVKRGLVSAEAADVEYGVVLNADLSVNEAATTAKRAA